MPRLRRPNAHYRDLQTRTNATDPRATTKGCRMTKCPSKWIIPVPLCTSFGWSILLRPTIQCSSLSMPRSCHPWPLNRLKCLRQIRQSQNQPKAASHFPHRSHPASHGFLIERFVNAGQGQLLVENSRNGPHQKTFIFAVIWSVRLDSSRQR